MKTGSPPTPLKARTGEFTPPGKRPLARASSRRDFSVFRDDMAGRGLAPLPPPVKRHSVTESLAPSCLRRADAAGAQVGLRLRTCKKPRAGRASCKHHPAERFFELASPHPRPAGCPRDTTRGCERMSRETLAALSAPPLTQSINAGRGVRCADSGSRAQIAVGVRGPRADASESTRCAVRAAPCLSLHVIDSPAGSLSAWRRRAMQPGGVSANDTRSVQPATRRAGLVLDEAAKALRARRVAQLAQRLGLDLADALAGHLEILAHFLEGVVGLLADAEPHAKHLLFARGERRQHFPGLLREVHVDHRVGR